MNQTNSEMPISSFTLNELITMAGGEKRPGIMGECIAANSASEMEIFRFPSRLNALIIGVGTEGETSLTSNLQEFRLKKDSLFIFSPKHILQVQSNNRFKAHLIVIAPDFLKRINIDTKRMMPLFLQFGSLPCMELTHAESQSLRSFISMVEQELKGSETDFSSEIIGGLIAATIYKVGDILTHYLTSIPRSTARYTTVRRSISGSSPSCSANTTSTNAAWDSTPGSYASRPNTSPRSSSASAANRYRNGSTTT